MLLWTTVTLIWIPGSPMSAARATNPLSPMLPPPLRAPQQPAGAVGSIDLAVQNTMANATGKYQQLVHIDSAAYANIINSNWSNGVPYYTDNDTPLFGWIEANATNTSKDTVLWLSLASIPTGNSTNVSIYFWPTSTFTLSAAGFMGEAPNLSAKYGEFDNGAKVFNFYDNFSGSTLSSLWKGQGAWKYTVNHGVTINATPGGGTGIVSKATFAYPAVEDFYGDFYQSNPSAWVDMGWGTAGCAGEGQASAIGWGYGSSPGQAPLTAYGGSGSSGTTVFSSQQYAVFTSEAISSSLTSMMANYHSPQNLTTDIPPSPLPLKLVNSGCPAGPLSNNITTQWMRERTYEPAMPKVSMVPYSVTFTEMGLPPGIGWWLNVTRGPSKFSSTSSVTIEISGGTFHYTVGCVDKLYAAPTGSFSVEKTNTSVSITFSPFTYRTQFAEAGLPPGTDWSIEVAGAAGSVLGLAQHHHQ